MTDNIKKIAISGGNGKMGKLLSEHIKSKDLFEISGIYDPISQSKEYKNYKDYKEVEADYLFEFSPSNKINENIDFLFNEQLNFGIIIGSSGISEKSIEKLKTLGDSSLVVVIPNFSIGASYQKLISIILSDEFVNKDIIEKHHSQKNDSPSGTAIDLANSINSKNNVIDDQKSSNEINIINNIKIESVRSDYVLAEQIVNMSNEFEIFNTEHIVNDRKAYLSGINLVLDSLEDLDGYYFGLESILKNRFKI
tara:strand:- start:311 stop:1066 length:756 start_codon:yes stop_codon:yes gene_type:complete